MATTQDLYAGRIQFIRLPALAPVLRTAEEPLPQLINSCILALQGR
jgi:hypothetical protein